jgi:hypothetical protein
MDFRNVATERLQWSVSPGKTARIQVAYGGAGKLEFQAPRTIVDLNPFPRFPGAVEMVVVDGFHEAFETFVARIEGGAASALRARVQEKRQWPSLLKFTAFNDAKMFDVDGTITETLHRRPGRYAVSMMMQLDGAWVSEHSWGVKFKVTELKIISACAVDARPGPVRILRNGVPVKRSMFIDDDDDDDGTPFVAEERPPPRQKNMMLFVDDEC